MYWWNVFTPQFETACIIMSGPVILLVALWGMTTARTREVRWFTAIYRLVDNEACRPCFRRGAWQQIDAATLMAALMCTQHVTKLRACVRAVVTGILLSHRVIQHSFFVTSSAYIHMYYVCKLFLNMTRCRSTGFTPYMLVRQQRCNDVLTTLNYNAALIILNLCYISRLAWQCITHAIRLAFATGAGFWRRDCIY
jgi:hypothetical protein